MATSAHTEAPSEGHKGAFPPFERETFASQLVWFAICFIALYLLMSKLALPRVDDILAQRRARIDEDLGAARQLQGSSDSELAAYEKALADARGRAQAIGGEIRDKVHAEAEENRKALETRLNTQLAESEKQIAATKSAAMANVRGIAIDASAAIVQRLIGTAPAPAAIEAAVDSALKN